MANLLKKSLAAAKVDTTNLKMTNTSIRKGAATVMVQNQIPTKTVMAMLGHKNPNSVTNYDCSLPSTIQKVSISVYTVTVNMTAL